MHGYACRTLRRVLHPYHPHTPAAAAAAIVKHYGNNPQIPPSLAANRYCHHCLDAPARKWGQDVSLAGRHFSPNRPCPASDPAGDSVQCVKRKKQGPGQSSSVLYFAAVSYSAGCRLQYGVTITEAAGAISRGEVKPRLARGLGLAQWFAARGPRCTSKPPTHQRSGTPQASPATRAWVT